MPFDPVTVEGVPISIKFDHRAIHIKNDTNLAALLRSKYWGSLSVARTAKAVYRRKTGKQLDINESSIAVEILGHVYPHRIGEVINRGLVPKLNMSGGSALNNMIKSMQSSTKIIDIGELGVDGNRWFWDRLSSLYHVLLTTQLMGF